MLLKITIFANFMREKIGHFALAETTDDHRPILLEIKIENWARKKLKRIHIIALNLSVQKSCFFLFNLALIINRNQINKIWR